MCIFRKVLKIIVFIPFKTLPFWPETDSMRMFVKFRDSKSGSQHFSIIREQHTVLRMDRGVSCTDYNKNAQ